MENIIKLRSVIQYIQSHNDLRSLTYSCTLGFKRSKTKYIWNDAVYILFGYNDHHNLKSYINKDWIECHW